jgi:serine protease DegS/serine protease DegQ
MSGPFRLAQFVFQAVIVGLALAFIATRLWPDRFGAGPSANASEAGGYGSQATYAAAVARAIPAVVNISTAHLVVTQPQPSLGDPELDRRAGISPYASRRLEGSLGAGVMVRADGYVLTNNHVILRADDIRVGLSDGRLMTAKVVGTDYDTDLAVLKVDGGGYPVLKAASADHIAVGDVALAIGNPLGMGQTVTLGIVSAIGRSQRSLSSFVEEFIQTDAAINIGNSGGALVNSAGELIGINTAVVGRAQGISFAIPASAALRVMDEIIAKGFVTRGWMGIQYTDAVNAGNSAGRGVAVVNMVRGSPAHQAGMLIGDILTRFNGEDIEDEPDLGARESALKPGTEVEVEGLRSGVPFKMKLALVQRHFPGRS